MAFHTAPSPILPARALRFRRAALPAGLALLLPLAILAATLTPVPGSSSIAYAAPGTPNVQWVEKGSYFYCTVDGTPQKDGIRQINGKSYLFDKKGRQQTGWHKVGKDYRFFAVANKDKGAMVISKVVNGVRLDKSGKAVLNSETRAELNVLVKATALVEKRTKPAWSQKKKLRTCYNLLRDKYSERALRGFSSKSGWQRPFALDILDKKTGSCHSYAAGFAYIANAIGCASCKVVSSGGHSWAEVNGKVYDPEWAKHCSVDLFAYPYSKSGWGGTPGYKNARAHIVTIAPRTKALKGSTTASSANRFAGKRGLVTLTGARYYVQNGKPLTKQWKTVKGSKYYFLKDGRAATGPTKIKGSWYVFSAKGKLLTGTKTRTVKVNGKTYRVTKSGKAKAGWDASKTHRFGKNGRMLTGMAVEGEKFWAFSTKGRYDATKTKQLRAAASMDADVSPLLALIGAPSKRTYTPSCYVLTEADGNEVFGQDGRLTYATFTVYTFKGDNGIEYFRGVEER